MEAVAKKYENVPVFQNSGDYTRPEHLVGRAIVDVDENGKAKILIETTGDRLNDFLAMGKLNALSIGAMINSVDSEAVKTYYEKHTD